MAQATYGLPSNDEKFGLNLPLSGFLQEDDVVRLKSFFIAPTRLTWLEKYADADSSAQSLREWVESRAGFNRRTVAKAD